MGRGLCVPLFGFTLLQLADAAARFTSHPVEKLYVVKGQTANFTWDYHVDNINSEFDAQSPRWYYHNGSYLIGYGDGFDGWKFKINTKTCPVRLRVPTVRVSVEGRATLVITNVSLADSGTYGCRLHLTSGSSSSMPTSEARLIVTDSPGPPSFNVTDIEASSAVIRWAEPVNDGGSKVTGYKVEIDSKTYYTHSWKPNYFAIPGLTKNKVYVVKLYARNVAGYGNASSKTFTTKKEGPPDSPVFKKIKESPTTATLSWSKPEENGGEIQYYTIYKKLAGEAEWSQVGTISGEPLIYRVKYLLPGKTYSFHVTAKNKDGSSLVGVNVMTVTLPDETTKIK
ncbi:twitchin-like [Exaiptasia diaphana]|uniref:Fibronectin type-III domain-containing protein n=1 Tax=Exaiptasia diaphana TaxID=2652724 RepID=A0A913YMI2_EXADI|nr:twitchin-like [Exaiptasia diaphana]